MEIAVLLTLVAVIFGGFGLWIWAANRGVNRMTEEVRAEAAGVRVEALRRRSRRQAS